MSNPTTLVSSFDGSLAYTDPAGSGVWTGVQPIRYDDGLWLEEATTNRNPNPYFRANINGWGSFGADAGIDASLAYNAGPPTSARWSIVSSTGSGVVQMGRNTGAGTFAPGESVTVSALMDSDGLTGNVFVRIWPADSSGTPIGAATATNIAATGAEQMLSATVASLPALTDRLYVYSGAFLSVAHASPATVDTQWYQIENKLYATSICPEVDDDGDPLDGYAFTGTAHNSPSTRAASSASVTIAEPAAIACWYREAYSGAKSFAYIEPYGTLGTYGSIAYAAGDLTISTTRNLVIGPFAAFDRELTATEQANLRSTQNWSMNSVNGSNIILPLSGRRRPR